MDRPYLVGPEELADELAGGKWVMWLWEWADGDNDHESWAAQFTRYPFPVQVVELAKFSVSFAWNADLPAPPIAAMHAMVDKVKWMRARGGVTLPSKMDILMLHQVPPGMLRRGPNGLRAVEPPPVGRHLRPVD